MTNMISNHHICAAAARPIAGHARHVPPIITARYFPLHLHVPTYVYTSHRKLCAMVRVQCCGRRYLEPQPAQPRWEGQVVLRTPLVLEATEETPVDGVSVMKNPMLGSRSLVFAKVWQPGCRMYIHP